MGINISRDELIYPYFVIAGKNRKEEVKNFPGVFRFSPDRLIKDVAQINSLGLKKILLFGILAVKDREGKEAYARNNSVNVAVREIKKEFPGQNVFTDVCLCSYTTHGHCGILKAQDKFIDNRKTVEALAKIALSHTDAGADWVAPSAMARGQVLQIRKTLDKNGYFSTKILGYSAKFASNFYGPFREAADSAPKFGDRSSYQLDGSKAKKPLLEIMQDIKEGADAVMVKPSLGYLDVIKEARLILNRAKLKRRYPLTVYNVSGEYAFVKFGANKRLWDEKKMVFEIITSIKRAGADLIISYHAKDIARWLKAENR